MRKRNEEWGNELQAAFWLLIPHSPFPTRHCFQSHDCKERILTDEMIAEIKALFPRYPTRQAVTLPALHIVNDELRYVPRQAVVEIAELLDSRRPQVQDTLSFYGYFKQDMPHGRAGLGLPFDQLCPARRRGSARPFVPHGRRRSRAKRPPTARDARICRVPRCLRICPVHVGGYDIAQGFDDGQSECSF